MLRQATSSNGSVKHHEGRYEIISLLGSFLNTESKGIVTKAGNFSVSLAGTDGRIVGGSVARTLMAGSQVQVIVGSFVPDIKKQKQNTTARAHNTPEPASAPANMLSFGGGGGPGSPRSQGQQHSSESSEENESNSPLHRGRNNNNNNNNHRLFRNCTPQ